MSIIKSAKTVDEAVKLALVELSADIADVDVKVIEKPKSGFLGFGSRDALVEVSLKNEKEFEIAVPWRDNGEWIIMPWDMNGLYSL